MLCMFATRTHSALVFKMQNRDTWLGVSKESYYKHLFTIHIHK